MRKFGSLLIAAGAVAAVWAAVVWTWQDPFTALYTRHEQAQLGGQYRRLAAPELSGRAQQGAAARHAELTWLASEAAAYRRTRRDGQVLGRIKISSIGARFWLVDGTDEAALEKGPGRDLRTAMPGQGQLVYIAGHRTTYLAPFSHIDQIKRGDSVTLQLPYATFYYRVSGYRIVAADDLSVLRSPGYESLRLQACHPRFFATHRYIVYALPVRAVIRLAGGGQATVYYRGPKR